MVIGEDVMDIAAQRAGSTVNRRFWALWSSTALSNLADGIFKLALPLLAAALTESPALVAGVTFAMRLPWLLFALPAGVWADRHDRRHMMLSSNTARVALLGGLALGVAMGGLSVPLVIAAAFLLGLAETLADTAGASVLPALVPPQELQKANARLFGVVTVTNEFVGPPLGGMLVGIGFALAFGLSAGLYALAAVALLWMTGSFRAADVVRRPMWTEIREGLAFVWSHDLLRTLNIIVAVMNFAWSAWAALIVLYVVAPGPGGLTVFGYGLMLTGIGIGGVLGGLLTTPIVRVIGYRWAIAADILGTVAFVAVPALTPNPWLVGAAAVIAGFGGAMWSIVVPTIRQTLVPDAMLGRVSGVGRLFGAGALAFGAAFAGIVAEFAGIPAVFAACAVLSALLFIPFTRHITASNVHSAVGK
jgi:MFS family permease